MIEGLDYDQHPTQHRGYARGRAIGAEATQAWMEVFAAHAPAPRPLLALDLGSGTGRFTPALARTFGEAVGVEPSHGMRAVAEASPAPGARYLAGRAEAIPLPDHSCGLVLMFLSFHHVRDREAAAREIARVLAPGGRVLIRSPFADRMPDLKWHRYFPSARHVELKMFPTVDAVEAAFGPVGLRRLALDTHEEQMAASLAEQTERLKLRAISTFEHLDEAEIEAGFAAMDAAVVQEREPRPVTIASDLLVLG